MRKQAKNIYTTMFFGCVEVSPHQHSIWAGLLYTKGLILNWLLQKLAIMYLLWIPERIHYVSKNAAVQAQPEDPKYFKSAVRFVVLLYGLCSGLHTLHSEITSRLLSSNKLGAFACANRICLFNLIQKITHFCIHQYSFLNVI